jgi:hypothetical protein
MNALAVKLVARCSTAAEKASQTKADLSTHYRDDRTPVTPFDGRLCLWRLLLAHMKVCDHEDEGEQ